MSFYISSLRLFHENS